MCIRDSTEAAVVSAAAGLLGWIFGIAVARVSLPFFTGGESSSISISLTLMAASVLAALFTGMTATIYPAVRAVRMAPGEALRILY